MKIKNIYDNGTTFDQYAIVTTSKENDYFITLFISNNPDSPQGYSQFGECIDGKHMGKKIKLSDLTPEIQEHIKRRLNEST